MEQNPDIAFPEKDTEIVPIVTPAAAPNMPPGNGLAIEDAETVRVAGVAADDPYQTRAADGAADVADTADVAAAETVVRTPAAPKPAAPKPAAPKPAAPRVAWLRHPEFWLASVLALFLRLWHLELTSFLSDQTALMQLARGAWLQHALPVTGIVSSIGTMNAPISVYLLMPFALFTKNPLPAVISIALWNVVGVALCYIFAQRYFGRIVAASGALLFASCASAVNLSRSLWPPNYLPPVLALWALTLYLGCVGGRRRWFVAHVALLTIAIQVHPAAALLIPVSLVGLLLAPRKGLPTRWEWAIAAGVVALLMAPTLLWEHVSRDSDLRILSGYLSHPDTVNLDVLHMIVAALGAPGAGEFGPNALYAQFGPFARVLTIIATLLFAAGMVVLTWRVAHAARRLWRENAAPATSASYMARLQSGALAIWRGLRAEPELRAHLLLWLWIVVPVVLLLRHSSALYIQYVVVLYPALFIVCGFAVQSAFRAAGRLAAHANTVQVLARAGILTLLTLLIAAQAFQSALFPVTLASGSFSAFTTYGYPLAEAQQLNAALGALQAEQDARSIFVSMPQNPRYRLPLSYLAISEHSDRVGSAADCLVLPAPDEEPALVVATVPAGPANALLSSMPELSLVASLDMAGSEPIAVYQMAGKLPPLLGERAVSPVTFADAVGNGLRLDALAMQPDGQIRLRWTVLGSATNSQGAPWYSISSAVRSPNGSTHALPATTCQPTRWHAGETVFTWVSPGSAANGQTLLLQVRGSRLTVTDHIGPLRVLVGKPLSAPLALLRPSSGTVGADGMLALPLTP